MNSNWVSIAARNQELASSPGSPPTPTLWQEEDLELLEHKENAQNPRFASDALRTWLLLFLLSIVSVLVVSVPSLARADRWCSRLLSHDSFTSYTFHQAGLEQLPPGIKSLRLVDSLLIAEVSKRWETMDFGDRRSTLESMAKRLSRDDELLVYEVGGRMVGSVRSLVVEVLP